MIGFIIKRGNGARRRFFYIFIQCTEMEETGGTECKPTTLHTNSPPLPPPPPSSTLPNLSLSPIYPNISSPVLFPKTQRLKKKKERPIFEDTIPSPSPSPFLSPSLTLPHHFPIYSTLLYSTPHSFRFPPSTTCLRHIPPSFP